MIETIKQVITVLTSIFAPLAQIPGISWGYGILSSIYNRWSILKKADSAAAARDEKLRKEIIEKIHSETINGGTF